MGNKSTRKRLIIKLSYPKKHGDADAASGSPSQDKKRRKIQHSEKEKPIVTCYWLDSTISLSQKNNNNNNIIKNNNQEVSKTTTTKEKSKLSEEHSRTMLPKESTRFCAKDSTTILSKEQQLKKVSTTQQKGILHTTLKNNTQPKRTTATAASDDLKISFAKEKSSLADYDCKNVVKDRDEQCALKKKKKNDGEKAKKEPMERIKRMKCWVILKRMMEGRDGWALKNPLLLQLTTLEKKKKPMCLKDVEAKLRVYSTPEEFAYDMRHVFSNALLTNPPGSEIYKIVERFSDSFEHKWESLKRDWEFEDRGKNIHKRRRE
ncbi:hypothetical protein P8452_24857 [Trifolium repens]|nr:hypothetical protein P8452_24857 [Trifolium repens]